MFLSDDAAVKGAFYGKLSALLSEDKSLIPRNDDGSVLTGRQIQVKMEAMLNDQRDRDSKSKTATGVAESSTNMHNELTEIYTAMDNHVQECKDRSKSRQSSRSVQREYVVSLSEACTPTSSRTSRTSSQNLESYKEALEEQKKRVRAEREEKLSTVMHVLLESQKDQREREERLREEQRKREERYREEQREREEKYREEQREREERYREEQRKRDEQHASEIGRLGSFLSALASILSTPR